MPKIEVLMFSVFYRIEKFLRTQYKLWYFLKKIYYFLIFKKKIRSQFKIKLKNLKNFKQKKIFIPLIETSHYQIFHLLALAKTLSLRGHQLKILICDGFLEGCEIKSFINKDDKNPCWSCKNNIKQILPFFGLDYISYKDLINTKDQKKINDLTKKFSKNKQIKIEYKKFDLTKSVQESLVRYFYGNKFFSEHNKIRSNHIKTALKSIIFAEKFSKHWNPDIILNNMPVYSAWEPFFIFFGKQKKRLVTLSLTPLNKQGIFFNLFELLISGNRFKNFRISRNNKNLNISEKRQLKLFIQNRINATDDHIVKNKIIINDNKKTFELSEILKKNKNKNKKNIFLFTNVYWDIGLLSQAGIYKDVISWTLDTINKLKNDDNINVFIKTHPAEINETSPSLTTLENVIKDKIGKLPKNVTFINPTLKINIYHLKEYIDLAVIFTGTLGLEMMMLNVPVVNVGAVPYDKLRLSIKPKNKELYYNELRKKKNINPNFKKEILDLYCYFYFIKTTLPWNLTKKAYGHRFNGYNFSSIKDLLPGKNKQLDHLCDCIIDSKKVPENWN